MGIQSLLIRRGRFAMQREEKGRPWWVFNMLEGRPWQVVMMGTTHTQTHIHHTVEPEAGGLNSGPLATWPQARKRLTHHRAQPSSPNPPH